MHPLRDSFPVRLPADDFIHIVSSIFGDVDGPPVYIAVVCGNGYYRLEAYEPEDEHQQVTCLFCLAGETNGPA
jgi:hypothetical protein